MSDTRESSETLSPGDRVLSRYTFGKPGTVVAVYGRYAWVMWDEYPDDHEPATHQVNALRLRLQ